MSSRSVSCPGCEVSCAFSPGTMHVLCYFVEPGEGPLQVGARAAPAGPLEHATSGCVGEAGRARLADHASRRSRQPRGARSSAGPISRPCSWPTVRPRASRTPSTGCSARARRAMSRRPASMRASGDRCRRTGSGAVAVLAHPLSLGLEMSRSWTACARGARRLRARRAGVLLRPLFARRASGARRDGQAPRPRGDRRLGLPRGLQARPLGRNRNRRSRRARGRAGGAPGPGITCS